MRRILAIGGGSFLMEDGPSPVDALILRITGKPRPRVCFVSTPSGDLPEHIDKFELAFSSEVCEPSNLAFFRRPGSRSIPLTDLDSHILQQDVDMSAAATPSRPWVSGASGASTEPFREHTKLA